MGRRRESELEAFFKAVSELPWFVGVGFAVALYFAAPHAPGLFFASDRPDVQSLSQVVTVFLRGVAAISLLAGIVSGVRRLLVARKFDRQHSLEDLRQLDWRTFEAIVGEAYRRQGYEVVETGRAGPDGGVDLVLRRDAKRYLVQCKHFREWKVGVSIVREIYGVVAAEGADGAIVVTTGRFTSDAGGFARGLPIELVDGEKLEAMVRDLLARRAPSRSEAAPAPSVTAAATVEIARATANALCPSCSSPMIERRARATGNRFYGCTNFPKCRGIRSIEPVS